MVAFQHPLGLFRLEHTPDWGAEYDAGAGTLALRRTESDGQTALHFIPLAVTGAPAAPERLLLQHAQRLGVWLPPDTLQLTEDDRHKTAYGEARRPPLDEGSASLFRFWVVCRKGLSVVITQLGPATADPAAREEADRVVRSLELPDVIPPTPAEFLTTVLKALRKEYPQVTGTIRGEWQVDAMTENGERIASLELAELYAEALQRPSELDRLLREFLQRELGEPELP